MPGTLTICSTGDGTSLSGHSWIEYRYADGEVVTYGTWGNNPVGRGNGLHRNLELGFQGWARRSASLDIDQEARLFALIGRYEAKGEAAWSHVRPCSAFAAHAWREATGERLRHRNWLMISNPTTLRLTILGGR